MPTATVSATEAVWVEYGPKADIRAFTWDDRGSLWILLRDRRETRLVEWDQKQKRVLARFQARAELTAIEFRDETFFVADGNTVRRFNAANGKELPKWRLPEEIFGSRAEVLSLAWAQEGCLLFAFEGGRPGVGRVQADGSKWDLFSTGLRNTAIDIDSHGFVFGATAGGVYHIPATIDFTIQRKEAEDPDSDIVTVIPPLTSNAATAMIVYEGDALGAESSHTLMAAEGSQLKQFRLERHESSYRARYWRNVAAVTPGTTILHLQSGPDGTVWMLRQNNGYRQLLRLSADVQRETTSLAEMSSTNLVELLAHPNSWHRERAAAMVADRNDLPNSRGLHPGTRLHQLAREHTNELVRAQALWSLHQMQLLEDYHLEQSYVDTNEWVRATVAKLAGERSLPTGMAFTVLEKLAQQKTNPVVRSAVAVAARKFASGSLVLQTTPPIPVREVFAGGVLSTLWFNSDHVDDPVIFWQYWNAISPITAFDPVHPLGFFQEEQSGPPHRLMRFVIRNILRQAGTAPDRAKLSDAIAALGKWHPRNAGAMKAAFLGLLDAAAEKPAPLTMDEREVIRRWLSVKEYDIGELAGRLLSQADCRAALGTRQR